MPDTTGRSVVADRAIRAHPALRWLTALAAIGAGLAVATGAMGAHAFRDTGDLRGARLMEVAAQYLMWHTLAVLALSVLRRSLVLPMTLLLASAALFSSSLVLLAFGAPDWVGAITPFGGLGLIVGWLLIAIAFLRMRAPA